MKLLITLLLILSGINFGFGSIWEYSGKMERPVAGAAIWNDYNNIFIIGGYSDSLQKNVNWYQTYDPFNETWIFDTIATPRFGPVASYYNGETYFYGGNVSDTNILTGIQRIDDLQTDGATFSNDINFNRNFSTGHIVNGKLYIIGGNPLPGTQTDTIPYIVEYNLEDTTITYKTDSLFTTGELPEQQMSEVIGDDIFIFGGVINTVSDDIYKFNTITKSYEKLDIKLLEPRAGGKAVYSEFSNSIYIIGGYNENSHALNTVETFIPSINNYDIISVENINDARYNFMATYMDAKIYIMGGYDVDGNIVQSIEIFEEIAITDNDQYEVDDINNHFELYQNYPNPFNPITSIKFTIPIGENTINETSYVELIIYDVIGNEITTLVSKNLLPGLHEIKFDASKQPSGVYYYQLKTNSFIQTKKMILLK